MSLEEIHCVFQHLRLPFLWEGDVKVTRVVVISCSLPHTVHTGEAGERQLGAGLKPSGSLSLSESLK